MIIPPLKGGGKVKFINFKVDGKSNGNGSHYNSNPSNDNSYISNKGEIIN